MGEVWRQDNEVHGHEVSRNSKRVHLELLPKLPDDGQGTNLTTLERLDITMPAFSLHKDNVVYFVCKVGQFEKDASVIAVDMRKKAIREVSPYVSGRILLYSYAVSKLSKYLGISGNPKRSATLLLESSRKRQSGVKRQRHQDGNFIGD